MLPRSAWGLIIALWASEIVAAFETAMVYAAQRALTDELGDPVRVGWLITSYLLIGAGSAAIAGRLGDLMGRRRLLLIMLVVAAVGSLMSAFAPGYGMLLAGRCVQGLTGAILPLCLGIVRENLPPRQVPPAIGLLVSGAAAGTAAGLVIGGVIVDQFSWHGVFIASAVSAAIAFVATVALVPPSKPAGSVRSVGWLGGLLFVPALVGVLLAISNGPRWGWSDPRTPICLLGGLLLGALWVRNSLRSRNPLLDVRLFADRRVLVANLIGVILSLSALQITLVFSLLLQAPTWTAIGLGVSATVAGLVKLPSNLGALFAGPFAGWVTARHGARNAILLGGLLTAGGWASATVLNGSVVMVGGVLILISFGTAMLVTVLPTILASVVPPDRTSEAAGMSSVVRGAAMGVGAQLVSLILALDTVSQGAGGASYPTPAAFRLAIGFVAVLTLCATLLAFALPARTAAAVDLEDEAAEAAEESAPLPLTASV
jgi:MFS family permease